MKKGNLMLGNIVLADYVDENEKQQTSIATVVGLSEHDNLGDGFSIEIETGIEEADYFNLRGIEIDTGILLKCGATIRTDNTFTISGLNFLRTKRNIFLNPIGNVAVGYGFKYLHELQNIIFLLTDTKLQWKE